MIDHIFTSLDYIRRHRPESTILLCVDFNQLKDQALKNQLQLRQLVKKPTRNEAILDKVYTTIGQYYDEPDILAPIGLSDHSLVPTCSGQGLSASQGHHGCDTVHRSQ